jgi:hypothetical protein
MVIVSNGTCPTLREPGKASCTVIGFVWT